MTELSWPWDTEVAGVGDGAAQLNEARSREFLSLYFRVQDPTVEGVCKGVLGELEVTGTGTPLDVEDGAAVCYGLYLNDAATTLAVSTPAIGTTGGRVVLQTNWAGTGGASLEARTRLAVVMSSDGVASIPALTQSFGTTWEISLATFTVTTGGVITVTDDRTFRMSTAMVDTEEIVDLAVTTAKLDSLAVTSGKIGANAVIAGKLANGAVDTAARLASNVVTAGKLADGAVDTTARLANEIVTSAKIANRTRKFFVPAVGAANATDFTWYDLISVAGCGLVDTKLAKGFGHFYVPSDYVSGMTATVVVRSNASGNVYGKHEAFYGADGESYFTHSEASGYTAVGLTANENEFIFGINLSSLLAGDMVSLQFSRDATHVNDTISDTVWLAGWLLEYTADS